MDELTKLERLKEKVVDTEAAAAAAALISVCAVAAAVANLASEAKFVAYANARLELEDYLKEQDSE